MGTIAVVEERSAVKRERDCIAEAGPICPVLEAMQVVGGKWKLLIIYHLQGGVMRFGALRKVMPTVTQKMLTQQLRELEADGLVTRTVHAEVPPRVEYLLTPLAQQLAPVLLHLDRWGRLWRSAARGGG